MWARTQVATCSQVCWIGCPNDQTGQEVCLGQWDHPFKAFMRQQYTAGNRLVGVYPEVSRVRHLFEEHGYTTSSDLQVRWPAARSGPLLPSRRVPHPALLK